MGAPGKPNTGSAEQPKMAETMDAIRCLLDAHAGDPDAAQNLLEALSTEVAFRRQKFEFKMADKGGIEKDMRAELLTLLSEAGVSPPSGDGLNWMEITALNNQAKKKPPIRVNGIEDYFHLSLRPYNNTDVRNGAEIFVLVESHRGIYKIYFVGGNPTYYKTFETSSVSKPAQLDQSAVSPLTDPGVVSANDGMAGDPEASKAGVFRKLLRAVFG